jgi:enoyl-CoA hydratase
MTTSQRTEHSSSPATVVPDPVVTLSRHTSHVAVITLNQPPVNVQTAQFRRELLACFEEIESDLAIRAVVIVSALEVFCAGGDLSEDQNLGEEDIDAYLRGLADILERIESLRVPVIAAINGGVLGGGLEFVLACDIRLAAPGAFFVASGVNVGLIVSFWRLPQLIGYGPAKEMLLTGSKYTAADALRWGLVSEVHPPEELQAAALAKAERIATRAPLSVEVTKDAINRSRTLDVEQNDALQVERFTQMLRTRDHQEALQAFFERRPANYERR